MGIQLPKYTIQEFKQQPSFWRRLLIPFSLLLCIAAGYYLNELFSERTLKSLKERNISLEEINNNNSDTIAQMETQIQQLETNKQIKQEALIELQQNYKMAIDLQNQLKSEINFYERLLSPDLDNKGLRVFEVALTELSENDYALKITLVQKLERAKIISGKVLIQVSGMKGDESQTLNLTEDKTLQYKFKYFENVSFKFSLPDGFNARQLVVKLIPKNAKSVEFKTDWSSLIHQE